MRHLILETDCQVLANLWESRSSQRLEIDLMLVQMEALSWSFEDFSLCFVNQSCNKVVHDCAKMMNRECPVVEWLITQPGLRGVIGESNTPDI